MTTRPPMTDKRVILITPEVLRKIPLPMPDEGGDKEERGRVLVVGGRRETPGALLLAGTAALRAGAGKLQIATGAARRAALEFRCVVALKGRETFIASPDGRAYVNRAGTIGLATSGSGDVLAGLIAGLVARGAEPLRAAAWGVYTHALAGERLSSRYGPLGLLARELPAEIPGVMHELSKSEKERKR
jgi:NAD(P)H-hydrate repair Nnr-like enzyme with NAD(P)H-hydrate dehydratase domain